MLFPPRLTFTTGMLPHLSLPVSQSTWLAFGQEGNKRTATL